MGFHLRMPFTFSHRTTFLLIFSPFAKSCWTYKTRITLPFELTTWPIRWAGLFKKFDISYKFDKFDKILKVRLKLTTVLMVKKARHRQGSGLEFQFRLNYDDIFVSRGFNFINILESAFCTTVMCAAFLNLEFVFVCFWQNEIGKKAAPKMLLKLHLGYCNKPPRHVSFILELI